MNIPLMKRQRELLGLSQEDVGAAVGRDRATVANWETGRTFPDARLLPQLGRLLQVTVDDLLAEPESGSVGVVAAGEAGSGDEAAAPAGLPATTPTPRSQRRSA